MSFSFHPIQIGGGGFSSGIDISPDGLSILTRVDVFGVYAWNSATGQHDLLQTTTRMPAGTGGGGGIEIVSAPSQSTTIYAWLNDGKMYRSLDRGASFVQLTSFGTHDTGSANGAGPMSFGARLFGPRMAVDPANPDVLYVGTIDGGVFVSNNASQGTGSTPTFSAVASVPTSDSNSYTMAFDPRVSQRTGGKSNIAYICSASNGVYQMTAAGGTFSHLASSPTALSNMVVSPNGIVYGTNTVDGFKFAAGSWSTLSAATMGINPLSATVDTTRSGGAAAERVIFSDGSGFLSVTTDSGSTWTGILRWDSSVPPLTSPEIPYLATAGATSISASRIVYDSVRDLILLAEGFGNWTAPGSTAAAFTWTSQSKGIESMEPQNVIASPATTSTPTVTAWDLGAWYIPNPDTYSAVPIGSNQVQSILGGWGVDWATSTPATQVYLISFPTGLGSPNVSFDASGASSDGGATFTPMPMSTQSFSVNLTTSLSAAAGTKILTFGSTIPAWIGKGMVVKNNTHTGTITGYIKSVTSTTITMDRNIGGVGVSSSDSITVGFAGSGQVKAFATNPGTASGAVLHFASLPTDAVHPGMAAYNLSNSASMSSQIAVTSVSGGDVTMDGSVASAIASGDVILFADATWGGAIAATSPNDFLVNPSDSPAFPYVTNDGGASWTPVNISGVPRNFFGSTTVSSSTVTVNDTSNLVIGGTFTDITQSAFQNAVVVSITDATHFVADRTAGATLSSIPFKVPGWGAAHYANTKNAAADRVTADTFYNYNSSTGFVYKSSNKGVTWAIANANAASFNGTVVGNTLTVNSGTPPAVGQRIMELTGKPHVISGTGPFTLDGGSLTVGPIAMTSKVDISANSTFVMNGGLNATMKSVPLNAGHLFMSNGFSASSLIRSTDAGGTWAVVPGVSNVIAFGFGKPSPTGSGYPTVFINGTVSGQGTSIFRSDDSCATWVDLNGVSVNVLGSLDTVIDLDGDKNIYGKLYGAYGLSGWFYGAFDVASSNVFGFSVIHDRGRRHTKMIGY